MILGEATRIVDGMPVPAPGTLAIDPVHSSASFHVRHPPGVTSVKNYITVRAAA
jgi:hypothetical protein